MGSNIFLIYFEENRPISDGPPYHWVLFARASGSNYPLLQPNYHFLKKRSTYYCEIVLGYIINWACTIGIRPSISKFNFNSSKYLNLKLIYNSNYNLNFILKLEFHVTTKYWNFKFIKLGTLTQYTHTHSAYTHTLCTHNTHLRAHFISILYHFTEQMIWN